MKERKLILADQAKDDLDDLFGRWSENEFKKIHGRISRARKIDQELWK